MNSAPFFLPQCSSLNKLCFSVRMTFSLRASEKTSASTADEAAVGVRKKKKNDFCIHYSDCWCYSANSKNNLFVWRLTGRLFPAGSKKAGGWGDEGDVGEVWCGKYGYLPPDSNVWLSRVLLCLLDCVASETYYYPRFPGWVIHWWGLPSSFALHHGVSHKANGPAGPLSDPFKARPLCVPVLQPHPCCPAPYYKCQRILIWLWVTKSSPGQCLCAAAIKRDEKKRGKSADLYSGHGQTPSVLHVRL